MKQGLLLLIFFAGCLPAWSQITDDTSELVYGAKTTQIIYESDLKYNRKIERHPDSTLYEVEKYAKTDLLNREYQDLGNNGTQLHPIFYPISWQIGRTSGLTSLDPYMKKPGDFQFYDTKSPFINLMVVFGGEGRSVVDMAFSRNIKDTWNFGFDIYRITSDKQTGKEVRGDRHVVGNVVDMYTYYQHPEKPYKAMVSITSMAFNLDETGGIYVPNLDSATTADLFQYQDATNQLVDARTADDRLQLHLYHEYAWTKPLQFYHQFDRTTHELSYTDGTDPGGLEYDSYLDYYDRFLLDAEATFERFNWTEMVNELGIKGDLANVFYRAYLKRRDLDYDQLYTDPTPKFSELFLGGYARFDWKEKFNVEASGEVLQSGEYRLDGQLNSDLLFGSYRSVRAKPGFLSESYFGNHHEWDQTFNSSFTNEITAGLQYSNGLLRVRPKGRLLTMDQFVYYDAATTPWQSGDIAVLASIGGNFDLKVFTSRKWKEAFHFENEIYYTQLSGNGADLLRVPELFYNGRIFWRGLWFKNTMGVEIGANVHAKSAYYALGFAPEVQQFHLQDDFEIASFYTIDAFLNMQVNNVRAFLKMTNINQQADNGYFISPYYPGQSQAFDFGVRWMFFD